MKRMGRRITSAVLAVMVFVSFFMGIEFDSKATGKFTIARAVMEDEIVIEAANVSGEALWIEYCQAYNALVSSGKLNETDILIYPYVSIDGTLLVGNMLKLAEDNGLWILYGAKEYDYETVYVCSPSGAFYKYQAMHPENETAVAGSLPLIIDTKFGSFGIALGKDLLYVPELARYYTAKGCRMILNPMAAQDEMTDLMLEITDEREEITVIDVMPVKAAKGRVTYKTYNAWGPASEDIVEAINFNEQYYMEWYKEAAAKNPEMSGNLINADYVASLQTPVISVVDFKATWGDLDANLNKMLTYIDRAYGERADIIVFPEMALQGYCMSNSASSKEYRLAVDKAITKDSSYVKALAKKAREYDMYIIFGASEKLDTTGKDKAYNSAFVVMPDGTVESYRKIHIVEGKWCQRGSEPLVVDTPYGKMGIAICKDTYSYPELSRYYMGMGCLYYINVSASAAGGDDWISYYSSRLKGIAVANNMIVVSANLSGNQYDAKGKLYGWYPGRGCVIGPVDDYYISADINDMSPKAGMKTVSIEKNYIEKLINCRSTYMPLLYADMYGNLCGNVAEEDISGGYKTVIKEVVTADVSNVLRNKLGAGKEYVNYCEYEVGTVVQSKYTEESGKAFDGNGTERIAVPVKIKCNKYSLYSDYAVYYRQGDEFIPVRIVNKDAWVSYVAGKQGTYYVVEYINMTKWNEMFCELYFGLYKLRAK